MKAVLEGAVIAESDDTVEHDGYWYFPPSAVSLACLEKAAKTESDRACPHGVQFYDVAAGDRRYSRAAWCYEAPRPALQHLAGRFGFWNEVEVGP